jgi:inhibitor of cysteine peptidase
MTTKTLLLIPLITLLVGCGDIPPSVPNPELEFSAGQATVETVEVIMMMSFPLQIQLHASGYVGDPCTVIDDILSVREDYTFEVTITTRRDPGIDCIQVIEPFEENIPLDVYGLPAGDYKVLVNGVEAEFSFTQDNILSD